MNSDKEYACYKYSKMDVVKHIPVTSSSGEFRANILKTIETVDRILRESEKILPIAKNGSKN